MRSINHKSFPVLDVLISHDDSGNLSFQVYRKLTHTDQYLSFSSHHPLQHTLGVICTLSDRAETIVSKEEDKVREFIVRVRRSLSICEYKDWAFDTLLETHSVRPVDLLDPTHNPQKENVGIPYVRRVTEALQRLLRSHGVRTYV